MDIQKRIERNILPNLFFDSRGYGECEFYFFCPQKYCDKKNSGIPHDGTCLILERGLYAHFVLRED